MDQWFIKRGEKIVGPGSTEQLQKAAKKGALTSDTLVANSANGPWIPLNQTGIVASMQKNPPKNPFLDGAGPAHKKNAGSGGFDLATHFKDRPVYGKSRGYASFVERAVAIIIDSFVLWIGSAIVNLLLTPFLFLATRFGTGWAPIMFTTVEGTILPAILYFIVIQQKWGWTVGRKVMGMHVEMANGTAPDMRVLTVRYFGAMLSSLILGIGYLIAFSDPQTRTLHDKIAGTVVVKD